MKKILIAILIISSPCYAGQLYIQGDVCNDKQATITVEEGLPPAPGSSSEYFETQESGMIVVKIECIEKPNDYLSDAIKALQKATGIKGDG